MTESTNPESPKTSEVQALPINAGGFTSIGYDVFINADRVLAIVPVDSAPVKRLMSTSKENGAFVDCTFGRKTRGIVVMQSGADNLCILGTAMTSATIAARLNKGI